MEKTSEYILPGNEAILASAGTGKTFTLAMRFITLLHSGVKPNSILASTFTNKAAGEIFDKIIEILLELSGENASIDDLKKAGLLPENFTRASSVELLRLLLQGNEDLKISTLDSFFLNIIRSFPLECGIFGDVTLLEEEDNSLRDLALLQWIRNAPPEERSLLREMVKNASFGAEQKSLYKVLQLLIKNLYNTFLLAPEKELYGGYSPLLASILPVRDILPEDKILSLLENFTEKFIDAAPGIERNTKFISYIDAFAEDVINLKVHHTLSDKGDKFWTYLLQGNMGIFENPDIVESIPFSYNRRKMAVTGDFLPDLMLILRHVRGVLLYRALERTKSVYHILESFHREFSKIGRNRGKIFFSDIPYLLRPDGESDLALPFSDQAGIEERLDAITDHYLLDEFQDTSDAQYRAMERLIDEVIADPSGKRSFFYVGDIKQSIYQWREGNPGLFEMIFRKYRSYGERAVEKKSLSLSYRSGKAVLDAVNAVFSEPDSLGNPLMAKAVEKMQFQKHLSSASAEKQIGTSILFELENSTENEEYQKARCVYELLKKIDPFRREKPLTVGVLFRTNSSAKEFAELFRKFYRDDLTENNEKPVHLPVSLDGKLPVAESPFFTLYSMLLLLSDHPGDPFAAGYFKLLRLGDELFPPEKLWQKLDYKENYLQEKRNPLFLLASGVRKDLEKGSFAAFLERFLTAFRDDFTEFDFVRMDAVVLLTSQLETSNNIPISMDSYREKLLLAASPNTSLRGSVQMMTIHKSKGLDFDIVIMPELNFREAGRNSHALMVAKDENFRTSFITFLPKTPYASTFSIFREEMEKNALSDAYEMCCNLYVGMTRARYALYLFADKKSKNSTTYQQREILYETFGKQGAPPELFPEEACFHHPEQNDLEKPKVIAYTGDPLWYEKLKKSEKKKSPILTERSRELVRKCLLKYAPGKVEIIRNSAGNFVTPSSCHDFGTGEKFRFNSDSSYTFKSSGNTALGTRVHQILENFPFSGNIGKEEFFRKYLQKEELTANSPIPHLLEGFFSPDSPVYQALLPPESGEKIVLWKEQEFLVTGREKEIISGTFDRVHLIEGKDGLRAEILDFKTDHLTDADEFLSRYSRQLDLYRTALSIMQHLPPEKISCYILALTPGLCIEVK